MAGLRIDHRACESASGCEYGHRPTEGTPDAEDFQHLDIMRDPVTGEWRGFFHVEVASIYDDGERIVTWKLGLNPLPPSMSGPLNGVLQLLRNWAKQEITQRGFIEP